MSSFPCAPTPIETVDQFRGSFSPIFDNVTTYPSSAITYWIMIATLLLNRGRWGCLLKFGCEQFVAHNIALEAQAAKTAAVNGVPGLAKGPISSETAGSVSLTYAVEQSSEPGGGYYNLTIYGQRFLRQARFAGAGPIQLGIGCGGPTPGGGPFAAVAWNGPYNGPEGPGWGT